MSELCNIVPAKVFVLAALFAAIPGAWIVFRIHFIRELEDQMIDHRNPAGIGTATVKFPYNALARIMIGPRSKWTELFDPTAREKLWKKDKTSAVRRALWFILASIFALSGLYCR
jgi:hypothetical protein